MMISIRHAAAVTVITIGLCLAMTESGFAAQRFRHADRGPAKTDRIVTQQERDPSRLPPYHPQGTSRYPWAPGYNLPYPDRPYGAPDRW
jgi:hypothetical protein